MNHLLKKACKSLMNSTDNTDKSMVYVNFNYFIKPRIVDYSIPYFIKRRMDLELINTNVITGKNRILVENEIYTEDEDVKMSMFTVGDKVHAFITADIMKLTCLANVLKKGRDIYIDTYYMYYEKLGFDVGNIYVNIKVLYLANKIDIEEFKLNYNKIVNTKYEMVVEGK